MVVGGVDGVERDEAVEAVGDAPKVPTLGTYFSPALTAILFRLCSLPASAVMGRFWVLRSCRQSALTRAGAGANLGAPSGRTRGE